MSYLSRIFIFCWLAISGQSSATVRSFSSTYLTVRTTSEESNQPVLIESFWPLMPQEQQLLFLQGSWLRHQHCNLVSLGLGWRYFPDIHWGIGYNLFYDQKMKQSQRRLGLGAESWWQSLTLTLNGYLAANGWQKVRGWQDYQQRPANGYDVTLRVYLPSLPHLGASLQYAHYFGNIISSCGWKKNHQNLQQWRWGIDITPIPLLTLAYHRCAGLSGFAKQRISATLTYRFSLPLLQQLDPNQITAFQSTQRQRSARAQREQLMVLKYAILGNNKEEFKSEALTSRTNRPTIAKSIDKKMDIFVITQIKRMAKKWCHQGKFWRCRSNDETASLLSLSWDETEECIQLIGESEDESEEMISFLSNKLNETEEYINFIENNEEIISDLSRELSEMEEHVECLTRGKDYNL